jgi:hypothetical protein
MKINSPKTPNRVAGPTLGYNEIVPTETVLSPDRKDRRRENDDSKHMEKIRREEEKTARQMAANAMLRDNSSGRNPWSYGDNLKSTGTGDRGTADSLGGYSDSSIRNLRNMPHGGSSNPVEKARPLYLHAHPEEHD